MTSSWRLRRTRKEADPYNGVDWLVKNHRDLIDAEFALNEGGKGELLDGKRISNDIQAAEKWYVDLRLEVTIKAAIVRNRCRTTPFITLRVRSSGWGSSGFR